MKRLRPMAVEAKLEEYSSLECVRLMWEAKTGDAAEVRRALQ